MFEEQMPEAVVAIARCDGARNGWYDAARDG